MTLIKKFQKKNRTFWVLFYNVAALDKDFKLRNPKIKQMTYYHSIVSRDSSTRCFVVKRIFVCAPHKQFGIEVLCET